MQDYGPQIHGHLKLAASCVWDFLGEHNLPRHCFEDFYAVAQAIIAPMLSPDCESFIAHGPTYAWNAMKNRLTTHHQKIKLVHIPPTTRQRWVKNDKDFQDPKIGGLQPDLSAGGELCLDTLEYIRFLDPEFVDARFNGSSHPNNPLDAAAELGITLQEFNERERKLERKVCEFLGIPISTAKRCACPPESEVAPEEGAAHAA